MSGFYFLLLIYKEYPRDPLKHWLHCNVVKWPKILARFNSVFGKCIVCWKKIHTLQQTRGITNTIELDLNRGVNPFGPIRRQDTKIGGRHFAFFPLHLCRDEGWTASLDENVTTSEFSPRLKLPPIIWVDRFVDTPLISPALWQIHLLYAADSYYRSESGSELMFANRSSCIHRCYYLYSFQTNPFIVWIIKTVVCQHLK